MATGIQISPPSDITVGTTAISNGTEGRVFFQAGGVVQQDAGFIFDSTAKTLTNYGKGALSSNTSFGALALSGNTTGTNNTAFGNSALQFAGSGANNTAIGFYALNNAAQGNFTGTGNIGIGYNAGAYIISGQNNIAIGYSAGGTLTTGSRNTIIGAASLASNSTSNNVVISDGAGNNAIWKDANNFVGIGHNPTSGTLGAKLDVRSQGALSTDIAFRVRNSADTRSNLTVNGLGQTRLLSNSFSGNFFTISYVADNSVERDAFIFTQNVQNAMGQAWTFDAGYNGVQERLTISNNLTGNNQGIFSIHASNFCFGTTILNSDNTADRRVLRIATGVAPTTSFTDGFKFYSADIIAGNAAPHFRTENGNIIKLYQQSSTGITTVGQLVTVLQNLGLLS